MIKFILILVCIKLGYSYPEDAPNSACTSMMLHHDVVPKQCQPKYIIQSDTSEYDINDIIRITVRASTNIDYFKGILLIAVNQNSQHIIGTWSTTNSSIKTISCDGTKNAAITDSSADNKLQIEALWHAPSILSEDKTIIKAAIVTSYDEIYVDCFTITLTPKQVLRIPSVATDTGRSILTKTKTNITWHYTEDTVTVTVAAGHMNIREWIAIGFSLDQEMGDEYVFICQVPSTGIASLRRMHTKAGKRPPTASEVAVNVIDAKYDNGFVTCHFSFETTSEQANNESAPIVIEKDYHLTFAGGILRTDEQVAKHNFTFVSSKTYQLQNAETIIFDDSDTNITDNNNTLSNSTGSSLTTTTTASPTNDVGVNVSWTYANGITTVKMVINNLKISQWFAMGISLDDFMGEDHVFICQHLSNNTISLQRFINPGGHSRPIPASTMADPGGSFNVTLQKLENGITYCDFTLSNFVDISRQSRQNNIPKLSQTSRYRPLIAIGNMASSNVILRHAHDSRIPLKRDVFLNRQETITYNVHSTGSDSTGLMKAHGIIMIFTWIVLVSTGILIARYFKLSWSNKKICNKAVWFAIHRAIMTCVAILTLIAFVLILVYKKGQWVPQHTKIEFVHSIFGIFVISFSVIQPFMALFRCNPDAHYRFIFNYAHATVGFSALTFSIVAIFLAMFFTELNFQLKKEWAILVVWLCWLPIIFIIFEVIEIYFPKFSPSIENGNSIAMYDQLGSNTTKTETISVVKPRKKDRIKLFALLLHILIAIGLALALMILIGRS
ncbi:unnamed protein product [Rotaria sp. Silwood1]|nr:unnamed protein product [Rotaria sp. Silwood1]CAF3433221.1 unnamed protein product [Rotaria sp. Silwood1]CAF4741949.1 unnamed protein product [Rotaria sp. Silwood1]CAF4901523.1 unnamed protein product [Rotaria sp. Silwood1]